MYIIRTDDEAKKQVASLPTEALAFYAQVLDVLELAPWNGEPYSNGNPDGNIRKLIFGTRGDGLVTYLILEDQQFVDVLEVFWFS